MRMGKRSADEFITDYLMTAGDSGFDLESTVDYFHQAIHLEILKQIYRLTEMPTTMNDWVKYTQRFDNQWRELQSIKSSVPTMMPRRNNPFRYDSSNAPASMNNSILGYELRVGVFIANKKDIWQTNALLGLCLGYMKRELDMFNQVVGKWGTTWLKLAEHWLAEEEAMAEHS
ncbi:hypothetical protein HETIRDRAFT_107338 [Heterobasidion irregulare TC 32-1]|uniref:Uncharacterized protein n=1 Tax=Heterobasidion irregulare (strain TC 32-1) TaxID=747525 RepID=W4KD48_HETIT|nr:uncharacterized protein HETIRDRAFT_107338 [Heterobasidion irregulare TC 32-1]ETW83250.1 hypothetical protein HETIRDRAFT_107338 [Heterobasidion irregulare TC 32-1]